MRMAAAATLDSKQWVKGDQGKAFGKAFAEHCGALSATPCQNGSSALLVIGCRFMIQLTLYLPIGS